MKKFLSILVFSLFISPFFQEGVWGRLPSLPLDEIILDIYNAMTELGEVGYEQLQSDLYALHETPIDLNTATQEDLEQLPFLSPRQIDDLLSYVGRHPMDSLYELRLIPSLADYEIRDLLPFVTLSSSNPLTLNKIYAREVFRYAKHELLTRLDARNIESFEGSDPMYVQARYRFDYQRRVMFGAQLRRPAGGKAKDLQYGAWLQLKDIGCLHTLVAGNFQASFGQGLVLAPVFRTGKSSYVTSVGQTQQGLRYYSSVDGEGLHGVGATFRHAFNAATRLDVSALYSMRRANDSVWHYLLGANLTLRHKQLQVELTAIENLWSDSIHPYSNAAYNQHYFRGRNQAVLGASARYNHGWFDAFCELATAQNKENLSTLNIQPSTRDKWGIGTLIGCRFYPVSGLSLIALYRYYSPYFDNALGYAFSETSRIGDENGGYLAFELTRWRNWKISGYADFFYFSGRKYGISYAPSWGYDALAEVQYQLPSLQGGAGGRLLFRLRAKQKGELATYSSRFQFNYDSGPWSLRTTAEANLTNNLSPSNLSSSNLSYGFTLYQDLAYSLPFRGGSGRGLSFKLRLQGFDARQWTNRIYCYEHDVLYAFSIPAVYGLGGRAYLCLKWQIIPQLALYAKISETVYQAAWAAEHNKTQTRTDLHLLLRATL